jgi:membrane protein involved in colicin uptake
MKSRYVVLSLSLVFALALAVPALGGPTNPIASLSATVKQTANKALKKAKTAQTTANSALSAAGAAQSSADAAQKSANTANAAAKTAQTTGTGAQTTASAASSAAKNAQTAADAAKAAAAAAQTTANGKFGNTTTIFGESSANTNTTSKSDIVNCPSPQQITGGGFEATGTGGNDVVPTFNTSYGDAWAVVLERVTGAPANTWGIRVTAICAGS